MVNVGFWSKGSQRPHFGHKGFSDKLLKAAVFSGSVRSAVFHHLIFWVSFAAALLLQHRLLL